MSVTFYHNNYFFPTGELYLVGQHLVRAGHADGPSWLQLAKINAKPSPELRILGLRRFNARNIHFELV